MLRRAWGSNHPDPTARPESEAKTSTFQPAADYQSPYAASPGGLTTPHTRRGRTAGVGSAGDESATGVAAGAPGPLDDILGQVTDLLSQVNDILGR